MLLLFLTCFTLTGAYAGEVRGVTDKEVKLACLVDFSGPGKYAGPALALGAKTYIQYINDQGG